MAMVFAHLIYACAAFGWAVATCRHCARANQPAIIPADEPTGNLDRKSTGEKIDNVDLEDLREFKESALGHAILADQVPTELNGLDVNKIARWVREALHKV